MKITRLAAVSSIFLLAAWSNSTSAGADKPVLDSDRDGLSDITEQQLLERFLPSFWIDRSDCAGMPAQFLPGQGHPIIVSADGTIYGQATPRRFETVGESVVELRYYHLWRSDCGHLGHPLDTEHVSVLIKAPAGAVEPEAWKALYWYAGAHEDTVCDASHITRADNLRADANGATVWISRGKHASFFHPELCRHGCGGDVCQDMRQLDVVRIVNLGEAANPMNDTLWAGSPQWPLAAKMARSDFDPEVIARIEAHPESDIVWVNPNLSPTQATIAAGSSTADALALANQKTDTALSTAEDRTGSSLGVAYDRVGESLKKSASSVGRFLRGDLHDAKAKGQQRVEPGRNSRQQDASSANDR